MEGILGKLETDMIIEATIVRLLNEEEIRTTDLYHVNLEEGLDTVRLSKVEKGSFGNYTLTGEVINLNEDNNVRKLSTFNYVGFVKVVLKPDKERQPASKPKKDERIAALLEGISKEDILAYLKGGSNG